jgi:hypothetical protein
MKLSTALGCVGCFLCVVAMTAGGVVGIRAPYAGAPGHFLTCIALGCLGLAALRAGANLEDRERW